MPKLQEYINLELKSKYVKGFEKFKTKWKPNPEPGSFRIGKLKDDKRDPWEEGNFLTTQPQKGISPKDLTWTETEWDKEKYQNFYSWTFEKDGEKVYLELTWKQNQNLTEKLPKDFPQDGVTIIPILADKTVDFRLVGGAPTQEPLPEPPAGEEIDGLPF